jgi:hypothetical protein
MSIEQLKNFCVFETIFGAENKTHIAQWALDQIKALEAQRDEALAEVEKHEASIMSLCAKGKQDESLLRECWSVIAYAPGADVYAKLKERLGL